MIGVVHLVWGPLGPEPLRAFLDSYLGHPTGSEHELVVLMNGVTSAQRPALLAELERAEHHVLELPDPVQDLLAYRYAAERLNYERFCFLNSYSTILAADWLAKLDDALTQPGVGIVGATGSWASLSSGVFNSLFLPNPYKGVVPGRRVAREQFHSIELEGQRDAARAQADIPHAAEPPRSLAGSVLATLKTLPPMPQQLIRFPGFPAYHIRTNGFMVGRALFADLKMGAVKSKMDAYALESGRKSFTRQVAARSLGTMIVARDGNFYEPRRWPLSNVFWQAAQQGLLVADNQTRTYANGEFDRRRLLSAFAWGPQAKPEAPTDDRRVDEEADERRVDEGG